MYLSRTIFFLALESAFSTLIKLRSLRVKWRS
jgi:hypothetical protein